MIILQGIMAEELLEKLCVLIDKKIEDKKKQTKQEDWKYMSRKEVAEHLKICLPTLHDWTKLVWLTSYKIGNRGLYKSDEVDQAVLKNKFKKYIL